MGITVDNAKINVFLMEPLKQTVALGEELNFRIKLSYDDSRPLSKAKVFVRLNDRNVSAVEKEPGIFSFSYVVDREDLADAHQLLFVVEASDAFGNAVSFNKLFEVTGELTLEYYFRENPLLFLSVIFAFVFILIVVIVVRNRLNRLGSLNRRKKQLEKLKGDLQERYFNLGSISNEQYYSLLSKYSSELRDIDSAIEAFKKNSDGDIPVAEEEDDVFKPKTKSDGFDDSELGSMFRVKKKKDYSDKEEVAGLFSLPKEKGDVAGKKPEKKKKPEEDDLWG